MIPEQRQHSAGKHVRPASTAGHVPRWRLPLCAASLLGAACLPAYAELLSGPEYVALQSLYSSTNGSSWTTNTGWNTGDACQWYGVGCDQDSSGTASHVTALLLPSNNLTGTLPALTAFTDLANFDVSGNSLTGSIPALAGLTNLGAFAVSHNKLTGSIPVLTGLTNLSEFEVDHNQLTGAVPAAPPSISFATLCPNPLRYTRRAPLGILRPDSRHGGPIRIRTTNATTFSPTVSTEVSFSCSATIPLVIFRNSPGTPSHPAELLLE